MNSSSIVGLCPMLWASPTSAIAEEPRASLAMLLWLLLDTDLPTLGPLKLPLNLLARLCPDASEEWDRLDRGAGDVALEVSRDLSPLEAQDVDLEDSIDIDSLPVALRLESSRAKKFS
mmetsp:Transcript_43652/g.100724  ORF Transcript_43652/g.100724 Transcript_43652/m.100724 type:complete len:118 (-) Transcript_43652:222-575(-)